MQYRLSFLKIFLNVSFLSFLIYCTGVFNLRAHEIQPIIADISIIEDDVQIDLALNIEIALSEIDASLITDTNNSKNADVYDALRQLNSEELKTEIHSNAETFLDKVKLLVDDARLPLKISAISVEDGVDLSLPRRTTLTLMANLPSNNAPVVVGFDKTLGAFAIRQQDPSIDPDDLYTDFMNAGQFSQPIPRGGKVERSWQEITSQYIISGIAHIIPKGLDHIIFIMGLFFFSPKWRPLLMQVTVFTLAHSFTLILATLGLISISASIVEPLIALSIVWIGIENVIRPKIGVSRLAVIFTFGLLHGLGFAFVLGEVGLAGSAFVISLVAFNIGVELGQLLVLAPLLVMGAFIGGHAKYRRRVEVPVSSMIALIGLYWFIERVFLG